MSLNLGSIAVKVLENYDFNNKISGNMISIANRARLSVENWTKATIGSTSIDEKYEPVIVAQTALMSFTGEQTEGTDKNVRFYALPTFGLISTLETICSYLSFQFIL